MESFTQRLEKLKLKTGITSRDLAFLLKMSPSHIKCIETEYIQPDLQMLVKLADVFNVSLKYMAMFTDDPKVNEDNSVKEIYVLKRITDGEMKMSDIEGTIYISRSEMHGKDYYALLVKDDSMAKARIFKGDKLIVRRQSHASQGNVIVAIVDGGEEIVRRYSRSGNIVTLTPEGDSDKYKTLKIDTTQTSLKILGKVCEVRFDDI